LITQFYTVLPACLYSSAASHSVSDHHCDIITTSTKLSLKTSPTKIDTKYDDNDDGEMTSRT